MMILGTKRLILREYTLADFDELFKILSDPETMRFYPTPYDEKGTRRWIEWSLQNYKTYGFGWWAVILKETGDFLGDCGVTMQEIDGAILPEIGYHFNKTYWRHGYAKEAAAAVRDWAFAHTTFDALYSYMERENTASWATAASIGMTRRKEFSDEHYGDMYLYKITREEWENLGK